MKHYEEMLLKYGLDANIFSITGGIGHPGHVKAAGDHHDATEEVAGWNFPPPQNIQADDNHNELVKCSQCQHAYLTVNNGIFWRCNVKNIDVADGNVLVECADYIKKD